ncbi:MAG: hypothetical protein KAT75_04855, partial [Dehalococcoidia bacterium]|nr:hypothetical protein [Dehalococcoidia bacterium]
MQKSRVVGGLICLIMVAAGLAFVWGIVVESYWAIAIPVIIGFLGMLSLGFWIGWTMAVTKIEPPPEATE